MTDARKPLKIGNNFRIRQADFEGKNFLSSKDIFLVSFYAIKEGCRVQR